MSAPEPVDPVARSWMTSALESGWHIAASDGGPVPRALCGHRLKGPVHRRSGDDPPVTGRRAICQVCRHAAEPPIRTQFRPVARGALLDTIVLTTPVRLAPRTAPEKITWPDTDPDEAEPDGENPGRTDRSGAARHAAGTGTGNVAAVLARILRERSARAHRAAHHPLARTA